MKARLGRMSHLGLSRAERDSRHAEMSPESRPQSVNVERLPSVVALWDASGFEVAVKDLDEPGRNVEQRFVWRESESLLRSLSDLAVELDRRSVSSGLT